MEGFGTLTFRAAPCHAGHSATTMDSALRLWISRSDRRSLALEANRQFPNETGGVLLGYPVGPDIVVTTAVGPGPNAQHFRESFVPDHDFHEEEIARLYERCSWPLAYLGDWHTHPLGRGSLSDYDLATLVSIASYPPARVPTPLMLILAGEARKWRISCWRLDRHRKWLSRSKYRCRSLEVTTFDGVKPW